MPQLFSEAEMQRRVTQLRESMDRVGIGCAVATSLHNVMYISGFFFGRPYGRLSAVVIPLKGELTLLSPSGMAGRARAFSWITDVRGYTDAESAPDGITRLVKEVLGEQGLTEGKIGVEDDVIPLALWRAFGQAAPKANLVDVSDALERQRQVKSAEEIALTRQIAAICETGTRAMDEAIRGEATEIEIATAGQTAIGAEFAARLPEFDCSSAETHFAAGSRNWGHDVSSGRRIERGDLLRITAIPMVMGYFGTLARRKVLGEVSPEQKRYGDIVIEAMDRCEEAMRPGLTFSEITSIAQRVFEKHGVVEYAGEGIGHSHGLMGPFWGREKLGDYRPYNHTPLQEGMITSMEPSLSVPGVGGFNINDMVLVTRSGAEVLTHYPRELESINR